MLDAAEDFAQTIEAVMGYRPKQTILPGPMHRFSTSRKAGDTAGWCKLFTDGLAGVYGNHRTGMSSLWTAKLTHPPTLAQRQQRACELQLAKQEAAAAQSAQWALAASNNASTWALGDPIARGGPAARYLESRGIHLDAWPEALRYCSGLDYWHEGRFVGWHPVMLGAVTNAAGQLVSVHRTHLTKDGRKADLPVVKKLTGCSARLAGCSIKLYPPVLMEAAQTLGVAEGIETALACFAASGTPTVAALSAHGMARYEWPQEVKNLIIYADHDASQVGQRAAATLAQRAAQAGLTQRVLTPPVPDTDWADVWAANSKEFL